MNREMICVVIYLPSETMATDNFNELCCFVEDRNEIDCSIQLIETHVFYVSNIDNYDFNAISRLRAFFVHI